MAITTDGYLCRAGYDKCTWYTPDATKNLILKFSTSLLQAYPCSNFVPNVSEYPHSYCGICQNKKDGWWEQVKLNNEKIKKVIDWK